MLSKNRRFLLYIENVKGLLTHNKGETLKYVINQIDKLGKYNIDYKVLNANNYDVPQNREKTPLLLEQYKTLGKKFEGFPAEHKYKPVLKDVLLNCPNSPGVVYSKEKYNIMKNIPYISTPKRYFLLKHKMIYINKTTIQVEQIGEF